jgi:hypothetical protein
MNDSTQCTRLDADRAWITYPSPTFSTSGLGADPELRQHCLDDHGAARRSQIVAYLRAQSTALPSPTSLYPRPHAGGRFQRPPPRRPSPRPPAHGWGCAARGGRCIHGWRGSGAVVSKRAMLVLCESGRIRNGGGPSRTLLKRRASLPGSNSRWRNRSEPALQGSCRRWATGADTGRQACAAKPALEHGYENRIGRPE